MWLQLQWFWLLSDDISEGRGEEVAVGEHPSAFMS